MNLKYGEPVGYGSVDEMNREETIKDILFDALHRIYVAEKFGNGTRREGVRKCLDDAYKAGLLRAAEIAGETYRRVHDRGVFDNVSKHPNSHASCWREVVGWTAVEAETEIRKESEK